MPDMGRRSYGLQTEAGIEGDKPTVIGVLLEFEHHDSVHWQWFGVGAHGGDGHVCGVCDGVIKLDCNFVVPFHDEVSLGNDMVNPVCGVAQVPVKAISVDRWIDDGQAVGGTKIRCIYRVVFTDYSDRSIVCRYSNDLVGRRLVWFEFSL